jgi:hypothetical protein
VVVVGSSVLVGRHGELETIDALLDEVGRGHGGVVLVLGEAGIGKSRLLAEAVTRGRRRRLVALLGRSVEGGGTFRALAGAVPDDRLAEREEVRPYRVALGRLIPGWAGPDDAPGTGIDPAVVLGEGLLRLLRVLGGNGCLLVLEDLHWADGDTLALVEYLAGAVAGWPVLVAVSVRDDQPLPEILARLVRLPVVTALRLPRLDAAEVTALAEHCNAGAPLPGPVRRFLIDRSEGLPFLVEELLAGVRATGPPWRGGRVSVPVPPTLAGLVCGRLAGLTPERRQVIEAAAVLGRGLDPVVLAAVVGVGRAGGDRRPARRDQVPAAGRGRR